MRKPHPKLTAKMNRVESKHYKRVESKTDKLKKAPGLFWDPERIMDVIMAVYPEPSSFRVCELF